MKATELKNADISSSATLSKLSEKSKCSDGRASQRTNRASGSIRPVRDVIASVKKVVDRIADHMSDRANRQTKRVDDRETAAAED